MITLATVVKVSTTTMTTSDVPVEISGTDSLCMCRKWSTSLTPMKARIAESPVER